MTWMAIHLDRDVPDGFHDVTKEQFFEALRREARNIQPTVESPEHTNWRVVGTGELWGRSFPGWRLGGDPRYPKSYTRPTTPDCLAAETSDA